MRTKNTSIIRNNQLLSKKKSLSSRKKKSASIIHKINSLSGLSYEEAKNELHPTYRTLLNLIEWGESMSGIGNFRPTWKLLASWLDLGERWVREVVNRLVQGKLVKKVFQGSSTEKIFKDGRWIVKSKPNVLMLDKAMSGIAFWKTANIREDSMADGFQHGTHLSINLSVSLKTYPQLISVGQPWYMWGTNLSPETESQQVTPEIESIFGGEHPPQRSSIMSGTGPDGPALQYSRSDIMAREQAARARYNAAREICDGH